MREHNQNSPDTLKADLFLLHAPSVYDFRERDDILFAYLSDSDSVNITSIYEMYPNTFLLSQMEHAFTVDGKLPADPRDAIRTYNRKILAYSTDQIIPVPRPFGGRWFDDFTVPLSLIGEMSKS